MDNDNKSFFKWVVGSQYFLYFGVMGIFLPYFNLYCYHLGFSGIKIGALSALRSVTMILFPLIWGAIADRFQIRKPIYILCNIISAGIWIFFLYTGNFLAMFIITFFHGMFYAPIISFLEAFTIDVLGREKKSYGKIRAWGSINFILIVIITGKMVDLYPIEIILPLILAGAVLQAVISIKIPDIKTCVKGSLSPRPGPGHIFNIRVMVFLFCAFLMLVSHGTYYGFFSIHLKNLGYGNTFIGMAWALASTAEIIAMIKSDKIFRRFSMENILVFSFMVAALRWFTLFVADSPAVILISQISHALTYGTFHMASILYIDSLVPDKDKTFGQAVNNAVTYGLGMMVGFLVSGCLYKSLGLFSLFLISGIIALIGGILFKSFQIIDSRRTAKSKQKVTG